MKPTILGVIFSLFASTQVHAWTVESTFEDGVIGQEADNKSGATTGAYNAFSQTLFSNERSHSGKQSAKATIKTGDDGWGEWGLEYILPGVPEGGEVWMRAWFYHGPEWSYHPDSGGKGMRLQGYQTSTGRSKYYFDTYVSRNGVGLGNGPGSIDGSFKKNNSDAAIANGPALSGWECLEMYIKYHSVPGKGVFRTWRNGNLWFEDKVTRTLPASDDKGATLGRIFTVFTNASGGAQKTQSNFIDDVVITNERPNTLDASGNPYLGCGNVDIIPPPLPPSSIY